MKKLSVVLMALLLPLLTFAQEATEKMGLDERINEKFAPISDWFVSLVFFSINFGYNCFSSFSINRLGSGFNWLDLWSD